MTVKTFSGIKAFYDFIGQMLLKALILGKLIILWYLSPTFFPHSTSDYLRV